MSGARWIKVSRGGTVLAVYAGLLLVASLALPWWRMENRAPQYGKRVLVVEVSPLGVEGDTKEIDTLGHYVGIRSIDTFAPIERAAAPYAMAATALAALALPFLRAGLLRTALAAAVIAVPVGFWIDLWAWQQYAVTNLDPTAALNMIADRVQAKLLGSYSVAQFKVDAMFQEGFWLAAVAATNAAAFLAIEGARRPRARASATEAPAAPDPILTGRPVSAAVALALVVAAGRGAEARTIEVSPAGPLATIGAGVAAGAPGDEVVVRAGVYREHVVVDRALTLRTDEGAVIDGGGRGTVLLVTAGPTMVRGFTVRGSGASLLDEDAGIRLRGAPGSVVEENRVEDTLFGILVWTSSGARVLRNHVVGKDLPVTERADGIRLQNTDGALVEGNTVERTRDLAIWNSNGCMTRSNTVRGARYGLHYMYCDDQTFEDNVFEGNQTGGAIMYSKRLTLRRNRFAGSRGPSAYGLLLKVADDVIAERNWFIDNSRGLFIEDTPAARRARCTLRANVIGGNDVGVAVAPSASRIVFAENAFIANRVQVEAMGPVRADANVWSEGGRGNYWSDHVGFDADGDGVGDAEHRVEQVFETLAERWPGAGLLRLGPAAEALEAAARAFPVVRPSAAAIDPHPLMEPPRALGGPPEGEARPGIALAGAASLGAAGLGLASARRPFAKGGAS